MGVRVEVTRPGDSLFLQPTDSDYTVVESSTPVIGGDSSGQVGTIDLTVPMVDNSQLLHLKPLQITDTIRGYTNGRIEEVTDERADGTTAVSGVNELFRFVIQAQADPFVGTVDGAFQYYCRLAGVDTRVFVHSDLASRPVSLPGFSGDLWTHMKEFAISLRADISLVSGVVLLAPVRRFEAVRNKQYEDTFSWGNNSLALSQEVIWYDTSPIQDAQVYPVAGEEPRILSVNAGETATYDLKLGASLSGVQQPIMVDILPPEGIGTSAYSVVGNDNVHITPEAWIDNGGSVTVSIGPDTRTLHVEITGATNLPSVSGTGLTSYRLALSAGDSNSLYSAFHVHGTGVRLVPHSVIVPTGATLAETSEEFAPTIDSIYINSLDMAYRIAADAATRHSPTGTGHLSRGVVGINQRGVTGFVPFVSYMDEQLQVGEQTYQEVQDGRYSGLTYAEVQDLVEGSVVPEYDTQVFGNAAGSRTYDRRSGHWFRARRATVSWTSIEIEAELDTTFGDAQVWWGGKTYGQIEASASSKGLTYSDFKLLGANAI